MAFLGVNIDHVATLRQARGVEYPSPVVAAKLAQDAGADQITCHLREDRRHIQDADIPAIQKAISIPLNLEMAATTEMKRFAIKNRPQKITIVPERREEITTEGGLNVKEHQSFLKSFVQSLKKEKIFVSLFIDPIRDQTQASLDIGADGIEFHTGLYCNASRHERAKEIQRIESCCQEAKQNGLFVAVGHGLNYHNIIPIVQIKAIEEYNIGHSIVAHAVIVGWERAVGEMKSLIP